MANLAHRRTDALDLRKTSLSPFPRGAAGPLTLERDNEAVDWLTKSAALSPRDLFTRLFLTSALALSGRQTEAKLELDELLRLKPDFTLSYFKSLEVSDDPTFRVQRERIYEGLRRAGLPP